MTAIPDTSSRGRAAGHAHGRGCTATPVSGPHPELWSGPPARRTLVLGVEPGQDPSIVRGAAELAGMLDAGLACVWVDPIRVSTGPQVGAAVGTTLVDPDNDGDLGAPDLHAADLLQRLGRLLDVQPVAWRFFSRTGDVVHALAEVAEGLGAAAIAVGARRPGFAGWMDEAISGSVAARLVHTQDRAVIVVPAPGPAR